jgi:Bacterial alpha-L-rhamnosidase 6 hairpin glycosidase domain/Bacterial alpha-L-rhamnosidase C-terminal domain/Protein of unknown function (DUF642)
MKNYLAYLQTRAANNILSYGLGDWFDLGPGPLGAAQLTPTALTATAFYYQDAQILADTAALLGQTNDAVQFGSLTASIRGSFNSTFYSVTNASYATGSQTAQAIPLVMDLVEPQNRSNVVAALVANVRGQGLTAGDIGHRYLLRALTDAGRSDVVFDLHSQTNKPGYGYILNLGATALTEGWDGSYSQDHFMLGHIMEWFYHDLAGIQPDPASPGFEQVAIKPAFVGGLTWVQATNQSARGTILSRWTLTNNWATLDVTIPIGTEATVYLPTLGTPLLSLAIQESGTTIWQNGAIAATVSGLTFDHLEGAGSQAYVVWAAGSGSYQFRWNLFPAPTGLAAFAANGQVALSWNAVPNASGYEVKRSLTPGGPYATLAGAAAGTNYTDAAVTNGAHYYYVVAAVGASGESADSFEAAAEPEAIANFGFEAPVLSTYQYNPAGGPWTFSGALGNGSGISASSSGFITANPPAPQGVQVAFIQSNGIISQTISGFVPGRAYTITFAAAERAGPSQHGGESWNLTIGGQVIASYQPAATATNYADYTAAFTASAPMHTLAFVGTDLAMGDNTVFLDNVRIPGLASTARPQLTWQNSDSHLQFAWPLDHTGWRLQEQTNSPGHGLGTNWFTVWGSTSTNRLTFPTGGTNGSVFFRLVYP